MQTVYIEPNDVRHLIAATFPEYAGKKVKVCAVEELTISGLNWTGGSRSRYRGCTLEGKGTGGADAANAAAPWENPVEGKAVRVPAGFCIVEHAILMGKDVGLTVYVNAADMPRYLPGGVEELTSEEKVVLRLVKTLIASYRREEARREGIGAQTYDTIVDSLKAKGLLAKNGGLSLAGKNVSAGLK